MARYARAVQKGQRMKRMRETVTGMRCTTRRAVRGEGKMVSSRSSSWPGTRERMYAVCSGADGSRSVVVGGGVGVDADVDGRGMGRTSWLGVVARRRSEGGEGEGADEGERLPDDAAVAVASSSDGGDGVGGELGRRSSGSGWRRVRAPGPAPVGAGGAANRRDCRRAE